MPKEEGKNIAGTKTNAKDAQEECQKMDVYNHCLQGTFPLGLLRLSVCLGNGVQNYLLPINCSYPNETYIQLFRSRFLSNSWVKLKISNF
jgi:hypothetical protein